MNCWQTVKHNGKQKGGIFLKKVRKLIIFLLVFVFLVSLLVACGSKNNGTTGDKGTNKTGTKNDAQNDTGKGKEGNENVTEVVYWLLDFGAPRTKHMIKAIDAFNEQNDKGIRVKVQIVPPTSNTSITTYDGKLLPAIVAGTAPDVICTGENHHVLVAEGIVQEITPYVENDKSFSMDQFYPQKVLDCYYNGKLYSLPFQLDINGFLVWNEDMFKEFGLDPKDPPKTLEQLDAKAEKMFTTNDNGLYETMGYVPWTWLNSWCVERLFNAKTTNPDGSPNAFNERMVETYNWVAKYAQKYGYDKVNQSLGGAGNEISRGKLAMQYCWIEEVNWLRNNKVSFNWSIGPFPKAHADAEPLWLGGYFMSVTKDSKVPEAAVEFMKFYCGVQGSEVIINSYLEEFGELTVTIPNRIAMEKYVDRMPEKYRILITDILPQMIVNRKEKLTVPNTYGTHIGEFRTAVLTGKGEVSALLSDLQKKMEFEWKQWTEKVKGTEGEAAVQEAQDQQNQQNQTQEQNQQTQTEGQTE